MSQTFTAFPPNRPGYRSRTKSSLCLLLVSLAACAAPDHPPGSDSSDASELLEEVIASEWRARLQADPVLAYSQGERLDRDAPALASVAESARQQRAELVAGWLSRLEQVEREGLDVRSQIDFAVFQRILKDEVQDERFGAWQIPINSDSGFHTAFARMPRESRFESAQDYEVYLRRLWAWPSLVDEHIANMRVGLQRGMSLPQVVLTNYDVTISSHIVADVEESLFFVPFTDFPASIDEGTRTDLIQRGRGAVAQAVVPGYQDFLTFFREEYRPDARRSIGASEWPNGDEYYAHLVRSYTTLDVTPEEVHEIGLSEVKRLRADMQAIIEELNFEGDFDAFLEFLRTDSRFYAKTPQDLLKEAAWICKRIDAALPAYFEVLPRQPYGVAPVPDHLAPVYTTGRYVSAAAGTGEPGYYWVNTYALESRPLYVLPALSLHEAVPGHHLQHAIAAEQEQGPEFRRDLYLPAFGEGWALYCEWLGQEMGIYPDLYTEFGRLTYEMWRACRLVVDTGIHAFGWERQRAIDYLGSNTALSLHEVTTEIDRYIAWPGQALSYKMGELEIRRLRADAEARLGADFDLRRFHDALLENGSIPLDSLGEHIEAWVRSQQQL